MCESRRKVYGTRGKLGKPLVNTWKFPVNNKAATTQSVVTAPKSLKTFDSLVFSKSS